MATEVKTTGMETATGSNYPRTGERAGMSDVSNTGTSTRRDLGDKADEAAHKAREAGETLKDKAKDAGETIKDKASEVGHSMQETGHNIAEKSKTSHQAICKFTRENPTAAVLLAFGVGAILARVLPKW